MKQALLAIFFLSFLESNTLEEGTGAYGSAEEQQTRDMLAFVRQASVQGMMPQCPASTIRITRDLRIYVGPRELKIRPMAKTVLLLFLRHPEGIILKRIGDYKAELTADYRRLMRWEEPTQAELRLQRLLDVFSNELNVNISRVNAALGSLVLTSEQARYRVMGAPGQAKSIPLDRTLVLWEA